MAFLGVFLCGLRFLLVLLLLVVSVWVVCRFRLPAGVFLSVLPSPLVLAVGGFVHRLARFRVRLLWLVFLRKLRLMRSRRLGLAGVVYRWLCAAFQVVAVFRFGVCRCLLPLRLALLRWLRWPPLFCLRRLGFAVFSGSGVVAVAGSRALPASGSALVVRVVADLAASGFPLVVGCCTGADAAVLSAVPCFVPPSFVRCFAAFGVDGVGACGSSAVVAVARFASAGGAVVWWAGGSSAEALPVRLAARTKAVVFSASAGLVVFFASPSSRGSLLACRLAVGRGLPVVAFPLGFSPDRLPVFGSGSWVNFGNLGGFKWVENQKNIFC